MLKENNFQSLPKVAVWCDVMPREENYTQNTIWLCGIQGEDKRKLLGRKRKETQENLRQKGIMLEMGGNEKA
jgi:hypothetical protein